MRTEAWQEFESAEVGGWVLQNSRLSEEVEWEGRKLIGDAKPSRDLELQNDAAFGAVVIPGWIPAPRCPGSGGLALGPRKAEQVRALGSAYQGQGGSCRPTPEGSAKDQRSGSQHGFSTPSSLGSVRCGPLRWGGGAGGLEGNRATKSHGKSPPSSYRKMVNL